MQRTRRFLGALLLAVLILPGCKQVEETGAKYDPVSIEPLGQTGLSRLTLTPQAVQRLGLATAAVSQLRRGSSTVRTIPYGAVIYDQTAKTWTYTNPEPLVYVRHAITIESIDGDVAVLSEGPPVGTMVVTVGAALLFGAESGVGK